MNWKWSWIKW